jgi:hypothetical protein
MLLRLLCLSLLLPASALADEENDAPIKAIDYTHCNMPQQNYYGYEPTHAIGENGGLQFKSNDKRVVSFNREENEETLYVRDFWATNENTKTKITLKKENGRPIWIESDMDPKAIETHKKISPKKCRISQPLPHGKCPSVIMAINAL